VNICRCRVISVQDPAKDFLSLTIWGDAGRHQWENYNSLSRAQSVGRNSPARKTFRDILGSILHTKVAGLTLKPDLIGWLPMGVRGSYVVPGSIPFLYGMSNRLVGAIWSDQRPVYVSRGSCALCYSCHKFLVHGICWEFSGIADGPVLRSKSLGCIHCLAPTPVLNWKLETAQTNPVLRFGSLIFIHHHVVANNTIIIMMIMIIKNSIEIKNTT